MHERSECLVGALPPHLYDLTIFFSKIYTPSQKIDTFIVSIYLPRYDKDYPTTKTTLRQRLPYHKDFPTTKTSLPQRLPYHKKLPPCPLTTTTTTTNLTTTSKLTSIISTIFILTFNTIMKLFTTISMISILNKKMNSSHTLI